MAVSLSTIFSPESIGPAWEILGKLVLGIVLGGVIGWEREVHGRPAGVRTHMLLVLGVTLISEVSKNFGGADPSRIAAQIVTGVGFLGAGTIMRMGAEVKGLTSAASLWSASGIGLAVSVGGTFIWVAIGATILALITLEVIDKIERRVHPFAHPREMLVCLDERKDVVELLERLEAAGSRVQRILIASTEPDLIINLELTGMREKAIEAAMNTSGAKSAQWSE